MLVAVRVMSRLERKEIFKFESHSLTTVGVETTRTNGHHDNELPESGMEGEFFGKGKRRKPVPKAKKEEITHWIIHQSCGWG